MADQLAIYNLALRHLKERRLSTLLDGTEPRRVLDDLWLTSLDWCLEQGPWTFAMRAAAINPNTSTTPTFGYPSAYLKPNDWLKTVTIAADPDFRQPITRYVDEGGYWYADTGTIFVRYVSDSDQFGHNLGRFSPSFVTFLALRLAEDGCGRITGSEDLVDRIEKRRMNALKDLRANDAMNTPPKFPPPGSWVTARMRGGMARENGGRAGGYAWPLPTADTTLGVDSDLPINTDFIPRT